MSGKSGLNSSGGAQTSASVFHSAASRSSMDTTDVCGPVNTAKLSLSERTVVDHDLVLARAAAPAVYAAIVRPSGNLEGALALAEAGRDASLYMGGVTWKLND